MARPSRRFWFVLALALGATVGELQARMGSREFAEWNALYQLDPFGDVRGDFQARQIASTVVNLFREKDDPAISPAVFLLPNPWVGGTVPTVDDESEKPPEPGSSAETREFLDAMGATRKAE